MLLRRIAMRSQGYLALVLFVSRHTLPAVVAALALTSGVRAAVMTAPDNVALWGLHCFCIEAVATPHRIVRMDDNGLILGAARNGVTIQQLRTNRIRFTESQLTLLQVFGLLSRQGNVIRTAIPLLGADTTAAIRSRAADIAAALMPALRPPIRTIHGELSRNGLQSSGYAVVFGYALDTLLWQILTTRAALPATTLTLQQPFWRGAFWAIYPERPDAAGTNELAHGTAHLTMVWTDPVALRLNQLASAPTTLAMLASIERSPASTGVETIRLRCAVPGCVAADQVMRVPSIDERAGNPLHDASAAIAGAVSRALLSSGNGHRLIALVPNATREQALVIVAHELIWEVADALVKARIISRPAVLGTTANTASLEPLLFIRFSD